MSSYPVEECPQCSQQFRRDSSGDRIGYSVLGQGETLTLIRCLSCLTELPVPETADASLTVVANDENIALNLRLTR